MRSSGVIIATRGGNATVQIRGLDCHGCTACHAFGSPGLFQLEAGNDINAEIGDRVDVEIEPARVLGSSFLVFVLPLLSMIAGYFVGMQIGHGGETPGIIGSFTALLLSFFVVKGLDSLWQKRHACSARIVGHSRIALQDPA